MFEFLSKIGFYERTLFQKKVKKKENFEGTKLEKNLERTLFKRVTSSQLKAPYHLKKLCDQENSKSLLRMYFYIFLNALLDKEYKHIFITN